MAAIENSSVLESAASETVHILGLGSIGSFVAYSLRDLPNPPPVTLLLHRAELYQQFISNNFKIQLQIGENGAPEQRSGFDAELIDPQSNQTTQSPISCLILAVKASATLSALEPIKHRIGKHTTICLFQNGRGQEEELNEKLFPDPGERPTFIFGIIQHGVYLKSPFEAVLAGTTGSTSVGIVGEQPRKDGHPSCRSLLDTFIRSPLLRCTELDWPELQRVQLLKLAANCILNPLTALLDVRNGGLLENPAILMLRRRLLEEISVVFQNLPKFKSCAADQSRFSLGSLEEAVINTTRKTASNSSSMREDIRKHRPTEIQFINGWIVRQGKKMGIDCPANTFLTELILAKSYQPDRP